MSTHDTAPQRPQPEQNLSEAAQRVLKTLRAAGRPITIERVCFEASMSLPPARQGARDLVRSGHARYWRSSSRLTLSEWNKREDAA
jgi:hypothetical protein